MKIRIVEKNKANEPLSIELQLAQSGGGDNTRRSELLSVNI